MSDAASVKSHQSTPSNNTGSKGQAPSVHSRTVVVHDSGLDTFDRYNLLFTGPDGLRHHRVAKRDESGFIGEGPRSGEMTSNLDYLFRAPKGYPFPKGKQGRLGEIGSEVETWNIKKGL